MRPTYNFSVPAQPLCRCLLAPPYKEGRGCNAAENGVGVNGAPLPRPPLDVAKARILSRLESPRRIRYPVPTPCPAAVRFCRAASAADGQDDEATVVRIGGGGRTVFPLGPRVREAVSCVVWTLLPTYLGRYRCLE